MSEIKIVIKHLPLPFTVVSTMLNKQIADLKVKYQEEKDRTRQESIRLDYESLESFVTMLASSQAKIFDF
jgi:type VI protein secretion system component Hcp